MGPKSKKANKAQGTASTASSTKPPPVQQSRPNWPELSPLVPLTSLCIEPYTPSQILLVRNLFTSTLCSRFISFLSSLPLATTMPTKSRDLAVRVNDRFQIDDPTFAAQLWSRTALKDLVLGYNDQSVWGNGQERRVPEILGLNSNIRVYRYRKGQFFDKHYDESNNLLFKTADGKTLSAKTTWTLLIYLSTCQGGDTIFYPERRKGEGENPVPISVAPEVGLGLLHRHGDSCMLHEGSEVTGGEKWVLRSDLVVKR